MLKTIAQLKENGRLISTMVDEGGVFDPDPRYMRKIFTEYEPAWRLFLRDDSVYLFDDFEEFLEWLDIYREGLVDCFMMRDSGVLIPIIDSYYPHSPRIPLG
jgi:hypothetical protein